MPHYEFFCQGCKTAFSKLLEQAEYQEGSVTCPHCGSDDVRSQDVPADCRGEGSITHVLNQRKLGGSEQSEPLCCSGFSRRG